MYYNGIIWISRKAIKLRSNGPKGSSLSSITRISFWTTPCGAIFPWTVRTNISSLEETQQGCFWLRMIFSNWQAKPWMEERGLHLPVNSLPFEAFFDLCAEECAKEKALGAFGPGEVLTHNLTHYRAKYPHRIDKQIIQ